MRLSEQKDNSRGKERFFVPAISIAFIACIIATGCTTFQPETSQGAATGDTVRVMYRMAFPGGEPFESNENSTPLEFVLGSGVMIKGFDQAIVGMKPGETKTVIIPPELGYGRRDEKMVGTVSTPLLMEILDNLEKNGTFTQIEFPGLNGVMYRYKLNDNRVVYYTFTNISPETTTVDQNHPLAGHELEATITLLEITRKA